MLGTRALLPRVRGSGDGSSTSEFVHTSAAGRAVFLYEELTLHLPVGGDEVVEGVVVRGLEGVVRDPLPAAPGVQVAEQPSLALGRGTQGFGLVAHPVEDEVRVRVLLEGEGQDTVEVELAVRMSVPAPPPPGPPPPGAAGGPERAAGVPTSPLAMRWAMMA